MIYKLSNERIKTYNDTETYIFPKYTSQLINWANQNAQGTRPRVVGQLSELFPEFTNSSTNITLEYWKHFYLKHHPDAIETATDKIYAQVENLKDAINLIDRNMVRNWVEDLVVNKTFNVFYVQKAILASLAENTGNSYRLATPEEESHGIDGFVGDTPYSVKPDTYKKTMGRLSETIDVKMIYYTKKKNYILVDVEE